MVAKSDRPTFRLYIFGQLTDATQLAVFGEFESARAVERIDLSTAKIDSIQASIRSLRSFIEAGDPPFEPEKLSALGAAFFNFIVTGTVRRLFDRAAQRRVELRRLLPFELFVEDHGLAGWPWEYTYDPAANSYLCQEFHPISRGIFTLQSQSGLKPIEAKIKIGILIGVLPDDPNTTPAEEVRWIRNVFETDLANDAVEIEVIEPLTQVELDNRLAGGDYHVIHFFGHARFDDATREGYLRFDLPNAKTYRYAARAFATMVTSHCADLRLVFLNACESGRAGDDVQAARSSIAAALLDLGVPAVIATQFSIPDVSAHYLSAMIYNSLASGRPLVDAMTTGRRAMQYADQSKFFDWGIPILYTVDPELSIFPAVKGRAPAAGLKEFVKTAALGGAATLSALGEASGDAPSLKMSAGETSREAKVKVAIVDLDVKAGFLPKLVERANAVQAYYSFEIAYLPLPSGAVLTSIGGVEVRPQLFIARVEDYFGHAPDDLHVDKVCCITNCLIAWQDEKGGIRYNYFSSSLDTNRNVSVISTTDLRAYAQEAGKDFSHALLYLCLGQLLATDRWRLGYHEETAGCLFDFCGDRRDVVAGLTRMRFDHERCRELVDDEDQLKAIDALMALDGTEETKPVKRRIAKPGARKEARRK